MEACIPAPDDTACQLDARELVRTLNDFLATLDEADQEGLTLSYEEKQAVEGKKRKQTVRVTRRYPFSEIKYTKEYLDFK